MNRVSPPGALSGPTYRGAVYPWHCDHMGHVSAAWYVERFDEATWGFLSEYGLPPSYFRSGHRGVAAVELRIVYRRELAPGDIVSVFTRLMRVNSRAVHIEHTLRHDESCNVAAVCELTAVSLNRRTRKAAAFPPAVVESLRSRLTAVDTLSRA